MTNTDLIEIAKANGADVVLDDCDIWDGVALNEGNIVFENVAQLQATIDAVMAKTNNEPIAYCRADTVLNWKGQTINAAMMHPSPKGLLNPMALYLLQQTNSEPVAWMWINQPDGKTIVSTNEYPRPSSAKPLYLAPPQVNDALERAAIRGRLAQLEGKLVDVEIRALKDKG